MDIQPPTGIQPVGGIWCNRHDSLSSIFGLTTVSVTLRLFLFKPLVAITKKRETNKVHSLRVTITLVVKQKTPNFVKLLTIETLSMLSGNYVS